jgi:hypothetical protein
MDWKDIAVAVGKAAPLLGTLLGGPAGAAAAVGGMIASALGTGASPEEVRQALATSPEAIVKLREIEATRQARLQELATDQAKAELAAAAQNAGDVNRTMRAESESEHWPTYSWRPAIGFAVALAVLLAVLTVFGAYGAAIIWDRSEGLAHLPGVLAAIAGIIGVVSPVLGIASWFRGRKQTNLAVPSAHRG